MSKGKSSIHPNLRNQINLKSLRRHDDTILEIVESTSYVCMYLMGADSSWVKTDIEGPMFIFRRSNPPLYGIFVLNRQGLEYVQEDLTPDADLEVMGDFMAFRPGGKDQCHGIWVYAESDRTLLSKRMDELKKLSMPSPASPSASKSLPFNQSISIDLLFASSSSLSLPNVLSSSSHPPAQPISDGSRGGAITTNVIAPSAASVPMPTGVHLLDHLFRSADQALTLAAPEIRKEVLSVAASFPTTEQTRSPQNGAKALLAMLGHPSADTSNALPAATTRPSQVEPPPAVPPPPKMNGVTKQPVFGTPLLSHDIFNLPFPSSSSPKKTKDSPAPAHTSVPTSTAAVPSDRALVFSEKPKPVLTAKKAEPTAAPAPPPVVLETKPPSAKTDKASTQPAIAPEAAETKVAPVPSKRPLPASPTASPKAQPPSRDAMMNMLDSKVAGLAVGMEVVEPLDKSEFIRKVLEHIYTPAFSTSLYAAYLSRFSKAQEMEESERRQSRG